MKPYHLIPLAAAVIASCSLEAPPDIPGAESVPVRFSGSGEGVVPADLDWRSFFTDPRLRGLVAVALDNNRDLRVAALKVEETRARYDISRSALFPAVDASAAGNRRRVPGTAAAGGSSAVFREHEVSVGITSYELDLFGRIRSLNRAALEDHLASDSARLATRIALVAQVGAQYFTERALLEQIRLSEETLASVRETHGLTVKRLEAGDVSELDARSVEIQVRTAEADLAAHRQHLDMTRNALEFLIGTTLPKDLPQGRSLDRGIVADVRAGVPSDLLARRPDILEAEHRLRAADADIAAARAAFLPRIRLTGGAGTASASLDDLFRSGSGTWNFSPRVDLPIFDGGFNRAHLEAAGVRREIEVVRYERAIQNAFREVSDGLAARAGIEARITAVEALAAAQRRRFELAETRYREGVDSYFEVLDAHQELYAARQSLITLRLARLTNTVGLYKALGGGW